MKKPVTIPQSPLGQKLAEAARLKAEAAQLLRQLEHQATGRQPIKPPGGWRHDPLGWQRRQQP